MRKNIFWSLWLIAGLALFAPELFAADGNYQNYVVGERAAGMGGAGAALARSVDACYYNPAGLAYIEKNSISLSASLYGFYNFRVDNGWFPEEDLDVNSFVSIPSTFGSILRLSDQASLAFSAFIPDRNSSNDLEAFVAPGHYFKYNMDDQTLWIGPSLGCRLAPNFSVGLSAFFTYRTFSWFRDFLWGNYRISRSEDIKYSDLSLLTILGTRYDLDDRWSLALTLQTPSMHLTGSADYLQKQVNIWDQQSPVRASYVEDGETENKIPTKITVGVAYQKLKAYAAAFDLSYHFPTSFNRLEGYDQFGVFWTYPLRREGTFELNLGGEYYVQELYPIRAGLFVSPSSAPDTDVSTSYYPPHINKYGLTMSVGRESENTTLNVGINYVWGSGDFVGWSTPEQADIVKAEENYLYVFLASSYLF